MLISPRYIFMFLFFFVSHTFFHLPFISFSQNVNFPLRQRYFWFSFFLSFFHTLILILLRISFVSHFLFTIWSIISLIFLWGFRKHHLNSCVQPEYLKIWSTLLRKVCLAGSTAMSKCLCTLTTPYTIALFIN